MPAPLPSSRKSSFWNPDGQSESELVDVTTIQRPYSEGHTVVSKNGQALCTSCPYPHSIPFDSKKYTIWDGKIVLISTLPVDKSQTSSA